MQPTHSIDSSTTAKALMLDIAGLIDMALIPYLSLAMVYLTLNSNTLMLKSMLFMVILKIPMLKYLQMS